MPGSGRVDGAVEAGQFVAGRLRVGRVCRRGRQPGRLRAFRLAAHREEEPEQRFQEFGVLLGRHLFQDHHEVIEGNLAGLDGGHPGGLQVLGAVVAGQGQHPGHGLRQRLGVLVSRPNGHPCVLGIPQGESSYGFAARRATFGIAPHGSGGPRAGSQSRRAWYALSDPGGGHFVESTKAICGVRRYSQTEGTQCV